MTKVEKMLEAMRTEKSLPRHKYDSEFTKIICEAIDEYAERTALSLLAEYHKERLTTLKVLGVIKDYINAPEPQPEDVKEKVLALIDSLIQE